MSVRRDAYTTKDLTVRTWPDFVSLFSKGNGWDFCWCMHFQRPRTLPKGQRRRTRAERGVRNRRQKKELVEHGLAHGILVYAKGEPVGWCPGRVKSCPESTTKGIIESCHWERATRTSGELAVS